MSLLGAMVGLCTNPVHDREWVDNGQRGAFLGAVFGTFAAFVVGGALIAMGERPW